MTAFTGPNGVQTFRAIALKSALGLYAKSGMRVNRQWTPTAMLTVASEITGKVFKRGEYQRAADELAAWIAENGVLNG